MKLLTCYSLMILMAYSCRTENTNSTSRESVDTQNLSAHNSRNSLDWAGLYTGILPCADCKGIKTMVKLNQNLTFSKHQIYEGKSEEVFKSEGKFYWETSGNVIQLEDENNEKPSRYAVKEKRLTQLYAEGNKIEGDIATRYELTKMEPGIMEKYWKLQEIFGVPVNQEKGFVREPHIILKREGNKIGGNGSCNEFSGSFELVGDYIINISKLASSRMMCPNMEVEYGMLRTLEETVRYEVMGDNLLLFGKKDTEIAKFQAVYLK